MCVQALSLLKLTILDLDVSMGRFDWRAWFPRLRQLPQLRRLTLSMAKADEKEESSLLIQNLASLLGHGDRIMLDTLVACPKLEELALHHLTLSEDSACVLAAGAQALRVVSLRFHPSVHELGSAGSVVPLLLRTMPESVRVRVQADWLSEWLLVTQVLEPDSKRSAQAKESEDSDGAAGAAIETKRAGGTACARECVLACVLSCLCICAQRSSTL
jgi:hypothetical protein